MNHLPQNLMTFCGWLLALSFGAAGAGFFLVWKLDAMGFALVDAVTIVAIGFILLGLFGFWMTRDLVLAVTFWERIRGLCSAVGNFRFGFGRDTISADTLASTVKNDVIHRPPAARRVWKVSAANEAAALATIHSVVRLQDTQTKEKQNFAQEAQVDYVTQK